MSKKIDFPNELDRRVLELSDLFDISQSLYTSLNLTSILDQLLLVPMGRMLITKGLVALKSKEKTYKIVHVKGLPDSVQNQSFPFSKNIIQPFVLTKENDAAESLKNLNIHILIPFFNRNGLAGFLGFGPKFSKTAYSDDEIRFLSSLANMGAQAIENAAMVTELQTANRALDQKVQELNTLFEIGRELNRSFEEGPILKQLAFSLMGQLLVNQFFLILGTGTNARIAFTQGSRFNANKLKTCIDLCRQLENIRQPVFIDDVDVLHPLKKIGVQILVPMQLQNKVEGFIFLGSKMDGSPFTRHELHFLSTLANMTIISLENARLIEELIEKKRLEEELKVAKNIQQLLLPTEFPAIPSIDIHGFNLPSKHVGGDYFDVIPLNEQEYIFAIADVSGKGMPAALLMSNLQAGLHSLATESYSLDQITSKLNKLIYKNTSIEKYITFFMLKLNTQTGHFHYVNAGHNPPLLFNRDGSLHLLEEGGLILGMMPDVPYRQGAGRLSSGAALILYTDGVSEAMNANDEEFGEEGLIKIGKKYIFSHDSESFNRALLSALKTFCGGEPTDGDDVTVLTIRFMNSQQNSDFTT